MSDRNHSLPALPVQAFADVARPVPPAGDFPVPEWVQRPEDNWFVPSPEALEKFRLFAVGAPWWRYGANIVPQRYGQSKQPAIRFGATASDWFGPHAHGDWHYADSEKQRLTDGPSLPNWGGETNWAEFLLGHGVLGKRDGLLLLAPAGLAVIDLDVDDDRLVEWVQETYGRTPLHVRTRRGRHLYYRVPAGQSLRASAHALGPDWARDALGNTKIDTKGRGGYVVAPGSRHSEGYYAASVNLGTFDLRRLPVLDVEAVEADIDRGIELRRSIKQSAKRAELGLPPLTPEQEPKPKPRRKVEPDRDSRATLVFESAGTIDGLTPVLTEFGDMATLGELPDGTRVHSPFRQDHSPSCRVWKGNLYDHSTDERWSITGAGARVLETLFGAGLHLRKSPIDLDRGESSNPPQAPATRPETDPLLDTEAWETAQRKLREAEYLRLSEERAEDTKRRVEALGIPCDTRVLRQEPGKYLADALKDLDLPPGTMVAVRAPHGTGKTQWVRKIADGADTFVGVANTVALVQNMSEVFDAQTYQEDANADRVVSTLNSLHKVPHDPHKRLEETGYARRFAFVDEADAVRDFAHSIRDGMSAQHGVLDHLSLAEVSAIASADLTPENTEWYCRAMQRRPQRVVYVDMVPALDRKRIVKVRHEVADEAFWDHLRNRKEGDPPVALAVTSGTIPQAYAHRIRHEFPDLTVKWVSKRNTRRAAVQDDMRDPNELVRDVDVLIYSPTIQSGVSITALVDKVFVLHTTPEVDPKTVAQMIQRCRNVRDNVVLYGMPRSEKAQDLPRTRDHLRMVAEGKAQQTKSRMRHYLPVFRFDYSSQLKTPECEHYYRSWEEKEKQRRETLANFSARVDEVAQSHAWGVTDERRVKADANAAKLRGEQQKQAKEELALARAQRIASAEHLSREDASKLARAYTVTQEEEDAVERRRLADYYHREVDPDLVLEDEEGKMRKRCRAYNRARLAAGEDLQRAYLGYLDYRQADARHFTDYAHVTQKAETAHELHLHVHGEGVGATQLHEADAEETAAKVLDYLNPNTMTLHRELFGSRVSEKTFEQPLRWYHDVLRSMGCEVTCFRKRVEGVAKRFYRYNWSRVHDLASAERHHHTQEIAGLQDGSLLWSNVVDWTRMGYRASEPAA